MSAAERYGLTDDTPDTELEVWRNWPALPRYDRITPPLPSEDEGPTGRCSWCRENTGFAFDDATGEWLSLCCGMPEARYDYD